MSILVVRDLRNTLGAARDQGTRPTCLAFATSDAHAASHPAFNPFSPEYIYYHAIRREGGDPHRGATLRHMLQAVELDGQPSEIAWPYLPHLPTDLATWKPPGDVGELHHGRGAPCSSAIDELCAQLDQQCPLLTMMTTSNAFFAPDSEFVVDSSEPPGSALHAVVSVGHGNRGQKRFVLVRNSWGSTWGDGGHAWISETYLAPRLRALVKIERIP